MAKKQKKRKGRKTKSAGRFGVRYGTRIRKAVVAIEERTHAAHNCPKCEKGSVKRIGTGIWECAKCGYTFAGGTYVPQTPLGLASQRAIKRAVEKGTDVGIAGAGTVEAEGELGD
jgi:large subunit ribosomal protein L37Ae